jgi:glycosyltransferase involved in cell wall biosynthesis
VNRTTSTGEGRAIVFGLAFDLPYAGIISQFLQYLVGLRSLGWDVWYVEDSLGWPYDPTARTSAVVPSDLILRVASEFERHGFGDRWIYRCAVPEITVFGASQPELDDLYRTADIALNVCGAQEMRDEHAVLRHPIYVQSDPFGLQIDIENGDAWSADQLSRHRDHFTFGENIGTPRCDIPTNGINWQPTRQPVALELWPNPPLGDRFTTVTTWRNDTKHKLWRGEPYYWTKDREFLALLDLPRHTKAQLELAIDGTPDEAPQLKESGWLLANRPELASDLAAYVAYVSSSRGEFTVARDQVVRPNTGWFSDRSAAYLGAGRPVVTQDTGFGDVLPTGEGLFPFSDSADAASALDEIESDPRRHARAARAIAEEYFAAERVLESMLDRTRSG